MVSLLLLVPFIYLFTDLFLFTFKSKTSNLVLRNVLNTERNMYAVKISHTTLTIESYIVQF